MSPPDGNKRRTDSLPRSHTATSPLMLFISRRFASIKRQHFNVATETSSAKGWNCWIDQCTTGNIVHETNGKWADLTEIGIILGSMLTSNRFHHVHGGSPYRWVQGQFLLIKSAVKVTNPLELPIVNYSLKSQNPIFSGAVIGL